MIVCNMALFELVMCLNIRILRPIRNNDIPNVTMQDKTNATLYPYLSVTNFKTSEVKNPAMYIINGIIAIISEGKANVY